MANREMSLLDVHHCCLTNYYSHISVSCLVVGVSSYLISTSSPRNNNSMTSSPIIGLDACITNVLMDIRKYLDVESTVRLSQTCRTFHNLLTEDEDDQYPKIKVSYFTFGDSSLWRDNRGRHIQESSVTKGVKIRSLATDVLPNIHWQSLKRIEFRLSPGRTFLNRDEELRDAFVYMAMGLESAHELEEFYIDVGHIMKFDVSRRDYALLFLFVHMMCKNLHPPLLDYCRHSIPK